MMFIDLYINTLNLYCLKKFIKIFILKPVFGRHLDYTFIITLNLTVKSMSVVHKCPTARDLRRVL